MTHCCERNHALGPIKQPHANFLFEALDALAERRLRHAELLRRPAKMQLLRDCGEVT